MQVNNGSNRNIYLLVTCFVVDDKQMQKLIPREGSFSHSEIFCAVKNKHARQQIQTKIHIYFYDKRAKQTIMCHLFQRSYFWLWALYSKHIIGVHPLISYQQGWLKRDEETCRLGPSTKAQVLELGPMFTIFLYCDFICSHTKSSRMQIIISGT